MRGTDPATPEGLVSAAFGWRLAVMLAALLLPACAAPPTARPPLHLTVLHTNDHHGRFWPNPDGEYGMAARKTVIDRVRAEVAAAGGCTLLLDGGDVNTGAPESDLQNAEPDFRAMSLIGYDAAAVGNHEFDKPPAVLAKQREWATFPLLSANIYKDGRRFFEPYRIFERCGYRIAVLGLTTVDTKKYALPVSLEGFEFREPLAEVTALLPELHAKADVVIAVSHLGHFPNGVRGTNSPGDVELARALPAPAPGKGLDLIVSGHSDKIVCMLRENVRDDAYVPGQPCMPDRQNGTWIVHALEWGKYVGRADLELRGGEVDLLKFELMPINLKRRAADGSLSTYAEPIAEDPGLRDFLQPFQDRGHAATGIVVGEAVGVFDGDRSRVRLGPVSLGRLIAQAMAEKTGADLAVMNAGGIRASLPDGKLTNRDLLNAQPWSNQLVVVRMSGAELLAWLKVAASMRLTAGGFPQTFGVQMLIEGGVLKEARVRGQPIEAQREYRLVVNEFVFLGGDAYPSLDNHPGAVNTGFVDVEVLREYIAARSPIRAADYASGNDVQRKP